MGKLKAEWKSLVSATIVLLLVCLLTTLAVSMTNEAFADKIAEQIALTQRASMERLIKAADYEPLLFDEDDEAYAYLALSDTGEKLGYIISTGVFGYGGVVSVMTAVADGEVLAIELVDCSQETPGLGQNAKDEKFTEQFSGLTDAPALVKTEATGNNEVQAVTGASITSKAVVQAVSDALDIYAQLN